jgi:hypothetical protein
MTTIIAFIVGSIARTERDSREKPSENTIAKTRGV